MHSINKITVIGGSGFVGTSLCKKLEKKNIPFEIIDLKVSKLYPHKTKKIDVRHKESLTKAITGNIIINLAAVHRDDVLDSNQYYSTNVDGAKNIIQVCKLKSIRKIVFTSTVAVYGFKDFPVSEDEQTDPFNHYGKSKLMAEHLFTEWNMGEANSLAIIRPTVIFGEGNRGNVYNLFNQINSGRFIMVGSGRNKKSMAYIENISSFILLCISNDKKYALYNYADSPDINMNELVTIVRKKLKGRNSVGPRLPYIIGMTLGLLADFVSKLFSKRLPISSIRIKKFCKSTIYISKEIHDQDFSPPFSLKEGINRTLNSEFCNPDPNQEIFYTE